MARSKWKRSIANWLCCRHTTRPVRSRAAAAGPVFEMEITLEDLDKLLNDITAQLELPADSYSNIAHLALQWNECKAQVTSFMQALPTALTQEVAQTSESLLLPLLRQAMGGLGKLHWMAVGLSFIAWSIDMITTDAQNRKDCLELLKRTLFLLKKMRSMEVWQVTASDGEDDDDAEAVQDIVEKAFQCAIICGSMTGDISLLRILRAGTIKDSIANLHKDLGIAAEKVMLLMQVRGYVEDAKR